MLGMSVKTLPFAATTCVALVLTIMSTGSTSQSVSPPGSASGAGGIYIGPGTRIEDARIGAGPDGSGSGSFPKSTQFQLADKPTDIARSKEDSSRIDLVQLEVQRLVCQQRIQMRVRGESGSVSELRIDDSNFGFFLRVCQKSAPLEPLRAAKRYTWVASWAAQPVLCTCDSELSPNARQSYANQGRIVAAEIAAKGAKSAKYAGTTLQPGTVRRYNGQGWITNLDGETCLAQRNATLTVRGISIDTSRAVVVYSPPGPVAGSPCTDGTTFVMTVPALVKATAPE
jgi:hypothetical protein